MALSADDLLRAQQAVNATLQDPATVQRRATIPDGAGGSIVTYVTVGTVLCNLVPFVKVTPPNLAGGAPLVRRSWHLVVPYGAVPLPRQGDRVTALGQTYNVVAELPQSNPTCQAVECEVLL